MAKKKGGKGKSKKAKAAELAAQQRLEEERLRLEEEERQRKIEEELLRQAEEARRQERIAEKRVEEEERLRREIEEDAEFERERKAHNQKYKSDLETAEQWNNIVKCDPLPDPANDPDFNSYLSLWRESTEYDETVLNDAADAEKLLSHLDIMMAESRQEIDVEKGRWCIHKSKEIFEIMHDKLNKYSARELVAADDNGKMVRSNILQQRDSGLIKFAMWTSGHIKLKRTKLIDFSGIGVTVDLPSSITMQNKNGLGLRVVFTTHDQYEIENTSALCSYGGVYSIDAMELPLPSSQVQDWVVREVNDAFDDIQLRPYPGNTADNAAVVQPVKITWVVPKHILIDDHPSVGWWDSEETAWSTQGVDEIKFDPVERVISMHTHMLKPLALLHPTKLDFPYQSWTIRPTSANGAIVQVIGSRLKVEVQVQDDTCKLLTPQAPELLHLMKPMKPSILLWELRRSGINILPSNEDAPRQNLRAKTASLEGFFHSQMSRVAGAFTITKSSWSAKLSEDEAVFRIRDVNAADGVPWLVVGGTCQKMFVSKHAEDAEEEWDRDEPEGEDHECYSNLKRVLESHCSDEQRSVLEQSSLRFQEAMRQTLNMIHLFTE